MKLGRDLQDFSDRLGHQFRDPRLLIQALTHPSLGAGPSGDNQRLEFLGDRVLNLLIAEALYQDDSAASEGTLAPRYNALVRKETCAEVARNLDLGAVLKLGRSESRSGGRRKQALLGDAMEAVLAAVFLDGGLAAARQIVRAHWAERIAAAETHVSNAKSDLQEWAQGRGLPVPVYVEIAREGPPHAPVFVIEARLEDGRAARAEGSSKRVAEQAAAAALMKDLVHD